MIQWVQIVAVLLPLTTYVWKSVNCLQSQIINVYVDAVVLRFWCKNHPSYGLCIGKWLHQQYWTHGWCQEWVQPWCYSKFCRFYKSSADFQKLLISRNPHLVLCHFEKKTLKYYPSVLFKLQTGFWNNVLCDLYTF